MPEELVVGNVAVKRGEFKKGIIKEIELNNNTSIDTPFLAMNGKKEGPTLLLVSTQHGIERARG